MLPGVLPSDTFVSCVNLKLNILPHPSPMTHTVVEAYSRPCGGGVGGLLHVITEVMTYSAWITNKFEQGPTKPLADDTISYLNDMISSCLSLICTQYICSMYTAEVQDNISR